MGLLGFVLATALSSGSPTPAAEGHVVGHVLDAFSGQPVAGAVVRGGGREVSADSSGAYHLSLAGGTVILAAEADGYSTASQSVMVPSGGTARIDIYLIARGALHEEVEVTATIETEPDKPATLATRPIAVETTAGGLENVFHVLQTLPGVVAPGELDGRLAVRGGGPDQNLTVVDGVEIYNPYRLFGLVSAFNPETIRSFELTTGAFDVKYGDRLSSLLLVETRAGRSDRTLGGSAAVSLTDANLVAEGRIPGTKQGSWLLAGRRTYYDLMARQFVDYDLPGFTDLQFAGNLVLRPGLQLMLWGLGSRETADASFTTDIPTENGDFKEDVDNNVLSAALNASLRGRGSSRTTVAYYVNDMFFDMSFRFQDKSRRSNVPGDESYGFFELAMNERITLTDYSVREELAFQATPRHLLETGFELHSVDTRVRYTFTGDRYEGAAGFPSSLDSSRRATRIGAWIDDRLRIGSRLEIVPGLRFDWNQANERSSLEPRLLGSFRLGARTRLRSGVGLYTQSPGYEKMLLSDYFVDLSRAGKLELRNERSLHAVAGVERDLGPGLTGRIEAYYKTFDHLLVGRIETEQERLERLATYDYPPELQGEIPTYRIVTSNPTNDAKGRAYGLDIYLTKRAVSADTRLTGWISYTYGVANRDVFGSVYPFEYDRRHAVSVVANWKFRHFFDLGLTGRFGNGFPRTPPVRVRVAPTPDTLDLDGDGDTVEWIPDRDSQGRLLYTTDYGGIDNRLSARYPFYARLDMRATFTLGQKRKWQLYLDIINVLNRKNIGFYQSELEPDPASDRPKMVEKPGNSIPFLPSFGVRFRF